MACRDSDGTPEMVQWHVEARSLAEGHNGRRPGGLDDASSRGLNRGLPPEAAWVRPMEAQERRSGGQNSPGWRQNLAVDTIDTGTEIPIGQPAPAAFLAVLRSRAGRACSLVKSSFARSLDPDLPPAEPTGRDTGAADVARGRGARRAVSLRWNPHLAATTGVADGRVGDGGEVEYALLPGASGAAVGLRRADAGWRC